DPFPDSAPAFLDVDPPHALWTSALGGAEIADLCENEEPNLIVPEDIGYPVQRIWSNQSAHAGTGPCVPVPPGEAYFNAVGRLPSTATVNVRNTPTTMKVLRVSAADTATVTADLRGGSAAPASWQMIAVEFHDAMSLGGSVKA